MMSCGMFIVCSSLIFATLMLRLDDSIVWNRTDNNYGLLWSFRLVTSHETALSYRENASCCPLGFISGQGFEGREYDEMSRVCSGNLLEVQITIARKLWTGRIIICRDAVDVPSPNQPPSRRQHVKDQVLVYCHKC
jgi:hypothetical protein